MSDQFRWRYHRDADVRPPRGAGPRGSVILAVLVLALAACGDNEESSESASPTDSSASASADSATSGEFSKDAVDFPLDAAGSTLDPATYLVDLLGTDAQFTVSDPWRVAMAQDGALIMEWPEAPAPFTRALLMFRPVDPAQEVDGLDADGSWIDQLADVEVLDRSAVTVGGIDSVSVDVTASAGAGEVPFIRPSAYGGDIVLRDSEVARVWIVDHGGSPPRPMVFFAPVLTSDTEWLSEADAVIESMVFGPVQEPPDL